MQQEFSKELARLMTLFNNDQGHDNIDKVKMQIESVKEVMVENIDSLLERGTRFKHPLVGHYESILTFLLPVS